MNSNLLVAIGLLLISAAVCALLGVWWMVLFAGMSFCAMGWVAHTWERPAAPGADEDTPDAHQMRSVA